MKKNFFAKLLIAYLVIILVYGSIAVAVFMHKNNELINQKLHNRQREFILQAADKIDTSITVAFNWVNQLKFSDSLHQYSEHNELYYYQVKRVVTELSEMTTAFSNFNYKIGVMKAEEELVLTPNYTIDKRRYFEEIGIVGQLSEEYEAFRLNESYTTDLLFVPKSESGFITIIRKETLKNHKQLIFFLSFYERTLLSGFEGKEAMGILAGDQFLSLQGEVKEADLIHQLVLHQTTAAKNPNDRYAMTDAGDYMIHTVRSELLNDLQYVYTTPHSQNILGFLFGSIKVFVLIAILGLIAAYGFAYRMYRPIKNTVRLFKEDTAQDVKDELFFIQESAFNLKERWQQSQAPLMHKWLRDLLYGIAPPDQVSNEAAKFGLGAFEAGSVTVVVVEIKYDSAVEESYSKQGILNIKSQVLDLFTDIIRKHAPTEIVELDYSRFAAITTEIDPQVLKKIIVNGGVQMESSMGLQFIAAIGDPVRSLHWIDQSFDKAMKLLEYKYIMDHQPVLTLADIAHMTDVHYYYPLELERDLISAVIQGNRETVEHMLEGLIRENLKNRMLRQEVLSQFVFAMVATLNRIHQQTDKTEYLEGEEILYFDLRSASHDVALLAEKLKEQYIGMMNRIQEKRLRTNDSMAEQMISFIHTHYSEDLSLSDLAEQYNLSAGYISTLFKSYTGENFKDYLNIYRVKMAKEIMQERKEKIVDIAAMVGCNNANTFIRIFKKYEGVSPGQYYQSLGKSEE